MAAESATRSAFTTSAPGFSPAELEALLSERYGLAGRVTMLTSERDLTARVNAETGERFVLKLANAAEDPAVGEFQNRALQHVARTAPDVPASRLVPTLDGAAEFFAERDGERHFTRLLTYLPGRPLFGAPPTPERMRAIGTALGRLARGLADFRHPASEHEIVWDLRHSPKLAAFTPHIEDAVLRGRVEAIFERFRETIAPLQDGFRRQVVHNDFNPFNLLIDSEDGASITGILDFGDMVETPTVYDLAVAAAYQVAEDGPPLRFVRDLVAAYHAVAPIEPEEADRLLDLIATRHAMTITIAEWRAARYPENAAYIRRNQARAKLAVERFAALDREAARAELREACGFA
ncbi:aminotransferase [Aureimonas endophytica]|uniref:Hydroxylysine kinase n=1 Tax=Aureimonas endophytica TaxID=2027858 RepID=A0A916ZP42_9HYPH|nr:phosphotransferase [Aureimonas endophytica]GGE07395.1 aminotransferase [Aureimonas endophytica]